MLKKIPAPLSGYLVAAVSFGAALAFAYAVPAPKLPGYVYGFLYVIAVFIAAWRGFGPGVLASLATAILLPFLFVPHFTLAKVELGRSAFLIVCSILVSGIAHNRRRAEAALREVNEKLEASVRERTCELSAAIASLQREARERLAAEQALRQSEARLHESSERLTNVLESINDNFIAVDRSWR